MILSDWGKFTIFEICIFTINWAIPNPHFQFNLKIEIHNQIKNMALYYWQEMGRNMILFNTIKFRINVHVTVWHPHEQAQINRCKAVKVNDAFNDKNHHEQQPLVAAPLWGGFCLKMFFFTPDDPSATRLGVSNICISNIITGFKLSEHVYVNEHS